MPIIVRKNWSIFEAIIASSISRFPFVILDMFTVQLAYRKYSKIASMKCFIPLYKSSCVKSNESTKKKKKIANISI